MRVVANKFEIFEFEVADVFNPGIQFHPRQGSTVASELFAGLVEMVLVEMQIAEGVNEIARGKINSLRHHHREKRVGSDIERHPEKQIAAALIKLTAELAVLDIKLKEHVTRRQRHLLDLGRVPRAHD